jgi:hypothetical protein
MPPVTASPSTFFPIPREYRADPSPVFHHCRHLGNGAAQSPSSSVSMYLATLWCSGASGIERLVAHPPEPACATIPRYHGDPHHCTHSLVRSPTRRPPKWVSHLILSLVMHSVQHLIAGNGETSGPPAASRRRMPWHQHGSRWAARTRSTGPTGAKPSCLAKVPSRAGWRAAQRHMGSYLFSIDLFESN